MSYTVTNRDYRKLFRVVVGLAVGLSFLTLSLKGIDFQEFSLSINTISIAPLMIGLLVYLANFILRSIRWKMLLNLLGSTELWEVNRVLIIGYALNNILPARLGEIARSIYAARSLDFPITEVVMTVFLERFCDFILLLFFLLIGGLILLDSQSNVSWIKLLISFGFILFFGVIFLIIFRSLIIKLCDPFLPEIIIDKLERMNKYLCSLDKRTIFLLTFYSIIIWIVEICSIFLLLISVNIFVGIDFLFILNGTAGLVTLAPTAPGYLGSLQFAFREVFEAFALSPTIAILSASLVQIVYFGSVCIIGTLLIIRSK